MANFPRPQVATPPQLRQALGYVPPRGAVGASGGGVDVSGGPSPTISLADIADGMFLGNFAGMPATPLPTPFDFLQLNDVPHAFAGMMGAYLRVNGAEDAVEFTTLTLPTYAVGDLPSPTLGLIALVTDAMDTVITGLGLNPTGSGGNVVPVFADGSQWIQL